MAEKKVKVCSPDLDASQEEKDMFRRILDHYSEELGITSEDESDTIEED